MINSRLSIINRRGAALLVVLFIVMTITILALGFLSRSDVELACCQNMMLRTQMDYLAESGLQHAKGLVLNPQDVGTEYWLGDKGQQLVAGSEDYYDVNVARDDSDRCNYTIDCHSYRLKDGEQVGRSSLTAQLRLDPCVALWVGADTALHPWIGSCGDVRCGGTLTNHGTIDGDVFGTYSDTSTETITGQKYAVTSLSLSWPDVTVIHFKDKSDVDYRPGDSILAGNVSINGMLLVDGDLRVSGSDNVITAGKNLPALYVTRDLIIEKGASLNLTGLAIVGRDVNIYDNTSVSVLGGFFVGGGTVYFQTVSDASGNGNTARLYNAPLWQPAGGKIGGCAKFDGSDDYAQAVNESIFDLTSQITVSAWIKVSAFNRNFQAIATKGDNAWRIQRWSNTNQIEFACTGLSYNPPHGSLVGNRSVNDGRWHHVAGVYDGAMMYLYVDGVLDAFAAASGNINTNNYKVMIGENAQTRPTQNRCWCGWMDDVRVYDSSLSAVQINIIKEGGAASGLIAHWKFDEGNPDATITAAPAKTAILVGPQDNQQRWGQAAGAFFRSIGRK